MEMNFLPKTAFIADRLFDGEHWFNQHAVLVEAGNICRIVPADALPDDVSTVHRYPAGAMIVPAFIDLQVYGALGQLLAEHPTSHALHCLRQHALKGGTAWTLPTVATNTYEVFHQCIDAVRDYWQQGGRGIPGLHIEGPWLHPLRKGAHIEEWIHVPTLLQARDLMEYGKGVIRMMTLAPERVDQKVMDLVRSYGVIISAGHSNATYNEAKQSFRNGISAVTHLFNAMSPFQHRAPGLAGAAMDDQEVMVSIIPDGYHVDYAAIRIAKAACRNRLYVITDAVTDTDTGPYPHVLAGDKYESNGILSGSALQMSQAVYNLVHHAGLDPGEALRMCSLYPARVLQQPDITGKIISGAVADIAVLGADYNVLDTIVR